MRVGGQTLARVATLTNFHPRLIGPLVIYTDLLYFFSLFSGGHLNPVVTLAMTIVRRLPLKLAPLYVVAQLLGGMIGAGLANVYKVLVLVVKITKSLPFK